MRHVFTILIIFSLFLFCKIDIELTDFAEYQPDAARIIMAAMQEDKSANEMVDLFDAISKKVADDSSLFSFCDGKTISLNEPQKKSLFWGLAKLRLRAAKGFEVEKVYRLKGFPSADTFLEISLSKDADYKALMLNVFSLKENDFNKGEKGGASFSQGYISPLLYDMLIELK